MLSVESYINIYIPNNNSASFDKLSNGHAKHVKYSFDHSIAGIIIIYLYLKKLNKTIGTR